MDFKSWKLSNVLNELKYKEREVSTSHYKRGPEEVVEYVSTYH